MAHAIEACCDDLLRKVARVKSPPSILHGLEEVLILVKLLLDKEQSAARADDAMKLVQRGGGIDHMVEHKTRDDQIAHPIFYR